MKKLYLVLLIFCPMLSIGQKGAEQIYFGGTFNLNNELSTFLAEKENIPIDDTAHIFFIKISANKKTNISDKKIKFQVFGKDTLIKSLIFDFLMSHKANWNYKKLKKTSAILPVFVASHRKDFNKIFIDWSGILTGELPESQLAIFLKPLIIQLYCCPSSPSKDF